MKGKICIMSMLAVLLVSLFVAGAMALDAPKAVYLNDRLAENGKNIERSEGIDIQVELKDSADIKDARLEASIPGYELNEIRAVTDMFDLKAGQSYTKDLHLDLPADMEEGAYTLRITLEDKTNDDEVAEYTINVDSSRRKLVIEDINSDEKVKAGHSILVKAQVSNMGQFDEKDVKVTVDILGMEESGINSDYIDEVKKGDEKSSEEIYLRIPSCQQAQEYTMKVTASNKYSTTTATKTIEVVEGDTCTVGIPNAFVTKGITAQSVEAGKATTYKFQISNAGITSQAFTVEVSGADKFADVEVYPGSALVVEAGQSKDVFVYLYADKDAAGTNAFTVTIKSGDKVIDTIDMTATVESTKAGWDNVKKGLEIVLIIVVVLLIILGLIIGFNKMKGEDEEESDETSQTYY
jgi:uncharacterized membrane protein